MCVIQETVVFKCSSESQHCDIASLVVVNAPSILHCSAITIKLCLESSLWGKSTRVAICIHLTQEAALPVSTIQYAILYIQGIQLTSIALQQAVSL